MSIDPTVSGGEPGGVSPDPNTPSSISGDQKSFNETDVSKLNGIERGIYNALKNNPESEKDKIKFAQQTFKSLMMSIMSQMQKAAEGSKKAAKKMGGD